MPFLTGMVATLSMHSSRVEYAAGWRSSKHPSDPVQMVITIAKTLIIAHLPFGKSREKQPAMVGILRLLMAQYNKRRALIVGNVTSSNTICY